MDVSDIMTNRTQIDWIDLEDTEETIVKEMLTFNHLLIPVCRCSLDDLLGLASVTDIFGKYYDAVSNGHSTSLTSIVEKA